MKTMICTYLSLCDILCERSRDPRTPNATVDFWFEEDINADEYGISLINPFNEPIKTLALGKYGSVKETEFHTPKFVTGDNTLFFKNKLFSFVSKHGGDPYCIYARVYDSEEKRYKIKK